jgi:HD-GYP domain-containing protein (c-di-GMP phosphodiesterase class II)
VPIRRCVTAAVADQAVELEELVEERRERVVLRLRGRDRTTTLASGAGFIAVSLALAQAGTSRAPSAFVVTLLVLAYALASRVDFEVGTGSAIPTQLVFVPMLFVVPAGVLPVCVALGLVVGALPDVVRGRVHAGRLPAQLVGSWHAVGPAVVMLFAGEPKATLSALPVLAGALAAQFGLDFFSSAIRGRLVFAITLRAQLRMMGLVYLVDAALTPVGFALAVTAAAVPVASLLGMPLVGVFAFFARERRRRIDAALELSHAYRGTAFLLGDVVEADDAYTGSHSRDVVELALAVAEELDLSLRERRLTELAALLHDIGKIRIPNDVINKPGPLSPEEWALMQTHTIEGERLLAKVGGLLGDVGRVVRSCHERWDGCGYPDRLVGEQIPLVARIVMCCDAFNAMTTDRSYRKALPSAEAIAELERNSGSQFDAAVVDALLRRLRDVG